MVLTRTRAGQCGWIESEGWGWWDWLGFRFNGIFIAVRWVKCPQYPLYPDTRGDQTRDLETNLYQQWLHCPTIRATINLLLSRRIRRIDWAMHKLSQLWYNHHSVVINLENVNCNVLIHSMRQWNWELIIICNWHICKLFLSKIKALLHFSVDCRL